MTTTDLPAYLTALDAALMALPDDCEAMVLSQLDGFIAGLVATPDSIPAEEWLPAIWGGDAGDGLDPGLALFGDVARLSEVEALILEHYQDVVDVLLNRPETYGPIYDVAEDGEGVVWDGWVLGFQAALALRPEAWEPAIAADEDDPARQAIDAFLALYDIANDDSDLPADVVEEMQAAAPDLIPALVISLVAWAEGQTIADARNTTPIRVTKTGRNDPCPCGSGKKYKKCCGAGA